jgi:hypothetical protein
MIRHLASSGRVRLTAGVCAMAVTVFGWSFAHTLRSRVAPEPMTLAVLQRVVVSIADTTSDDVIDVAVERDPFSPSRQAPATRYGVAPIAGAGVAVAANVVAERAAVRLVGTVLDANGESFVLCQLGSAPARILRVGQKLGTYVLKSIAQGAATFVTDGGDRIELRVPKTGS